MLSRAFDHICMEKARYKFLIIIIINYFGQSFDGSMLSREYSVLELAKNRNGLVWLSVVDVEIAGLHVEYIPKRWVMFTLLVYCMFRATRHKKKL